MMQHSAADSDLMAVVREYVQAQNALLRSLLSSAGGTLGPQPRTWPQRGHVIVDGTTWAYRRHGLGYAFEEVGGGDLVEAHEHILSEPYPFDAFRLQEFLRTRGVSKIAFDGQQLEAELFSLQTALDKLVARGYLDVYTTSSTSPVKSYTLRNQR